MAAMKRPGGLPACGFLVMATKGGQPPVSVEKRPKGKKVTIINNVKGNARALCTTLMNLLGTGGTVTQRGDSADVEVQGEQVDRVVHALEQLKCMKGLPVTKETATVVQRDCAYDAILGSDRHKARWSDTGKTHAEVLIPPDDAPCISWHGHWIYCRGNCVQIDTNCSTWFELGAEPEVASQESEYPSSPTLGAALAAALRRLGMLPEPGNAVRAWMAERAAETEDAARKRAIAAPALSCAAPRVNVTWNPLVCDVCGASFSLKKTLNEHKRRAHDIERAGSVANLTSASAAELSWPLASAEQVAVQEAKEDMHYWEGQSYQPDVVDLDFLHDLENPSRPQTTASLGDFMTVKAAKKPQQKKPNAQQAATRRPVAMTTCPVCGGSFPEAEIERHVNACIEASTEATPTVDGIHADTLQPELLESLLDLELPAEGTARFWECFEEASANPGSVAAEAFGYAIAVVLDELSEQTDMSIMVTDRAATKRPAYRLDQEGSLRVVEESASGPSDAEAAIPESAVESEMACPVCEAMFPARMLQHHVEQCLDSFAPCVSKHSATEGSAQQQSATQRATGKLGSRKGRWPRRQAEPVGGCNDLHSNQNDDAAAGGDLTTAAAPADWVRHSLSSLISSDDAESLAIGVEVILGEGDIDAAANAVALLAAELPESEHSADLLRQFHALLDRWRGSVA